MSEIDIDVLSAEEYAKTAASISVLEAQPFFAQWHAWHLLHGGKVPETPYIGETEANLHKLFFEVLTLGGAKQVSTDFYRSIQQILSPFRLLKRIVGQSSLATSDTSMPLSAPSPCLDRMLLPSCDKRISLV